MARSPVFGMPELTLSPFDQSRTCDSLILTSSFNQVSSKQLILTTQYVAPFHELRRASQVNQRHLRNVAPQRSDAYVSPAAIVFISLTGNQLNTKRNDALHKHDDGTSCRCRVDWYFLQSFCLAPTLRSILVCRRHADTIDFEWHAAWLRILLLFCIQLVPTLPLLHVIFCWRHGPTDHVMPLTPCERNRLASLVI